MTVTAKSSDSIHLDQVTVHKDLNHMKNCPRVLKQRIFCYLKLKDQVSDTKGSVIFIHNGISSLIQKVKVKVLKKLASER